MGEFAPRLPVIAPSRLVECSRCAQCCTYVAVEIDEPTTLRTATTILWFLYHDKVSVIRERRHRWTVQFETRCRNLGDDLLCGIYPFRPHLCREYEREDCEVNGRGRSRTFRAPGEFLEYMKKEHPRIYRRLERGFVDPKNGGPEHSGPEAVRPTRAGRRRSKKKGPRGRGRTGL